MKMHNTVTERYLNLSLKMHNMVPEQYLNLSLKMHNTVPEWYLNLSLSVYCLSFNGGKIILFPVWLAPCCTIHSVFIVSLS